MNRRFTRLAGCLTLAAAVWGCDDAAEPGAGDAFFGGDTDRGVIRVDGGGGRDARVDAAVVIDAAPPVDAQVDAAMGCASDEACPEGTFCDPAGRCLAGCRADGECAVGERCVEHACVAQAPDCVGDGDCEAGERCANGACVADAPDCVADADCAADERCLDGACVAQPPECERDGDCEAGERCAAGVCEPVEPPACVRDGDCALGEACVDGACEPAAPLCAEDADCAPNERCVDGACELAVGCLEDADCAPDELCVDQACAAVPCLGDGDCGLGEACVDGACEPAPPMCAEDADCAGGERCVGGQCRPPAADACVAPMPANVGDALIGDTGDHLADHGDASCGDGAVGPEAVYRLNVAEPTTVCLDLAGSDFDTVLHVRTDCADAASEVACNDDDFEITGGVQSALTLEAAAGTDYFIFVDGFGGRFGQYALAIRPGACAPPGECAEDADCEAGERCLESVCAPAPPVCAEDADCPLGHACVDGVCVGAGDACAAPGELVLGEAVEGTTEGAPATHAASCGGGAAGPEVAFRLPPVAADTTICLDLEGSTFDTVLHVREGVCADGAAEVGCNDDPDAVDRLQSQLTIEAVAGAEYFVLVDSFGAAGGMFRLSATAGPCAAPACADDFDCGFDEICEAGACQLAECVADGDCAPGQDCAAGRCEGAVACADDAGCRPGDACVAGQCEPSPACAGPEDCGANQICLAGVCVDDPPLCDADADCPRDFSCAAGQCTADAPACADDAMCPANTRCFAGVCVNAPPGPCAEDADCPEGLVCGADGACVLAAVRTCDAPIPVRQFGRFVGNTVAASDDQQPSCGGAGGPEAAYALRFDADVEICLRVLDADFAPALSARTDCADAGTELGCDAASLTLQAQGGVDYTVLIDSTDGGRGNYTLEVAPGACAPLIDACADPTPIGFERVVGSTVDGPALHRALCVGNGPEAVYAFTAQADGVVCASTAGSNYDTGLYVRAGDCAEGAEVACNDDVDGVGVQSRAEWATQAGATYFVFVDGFGAGGGDYVLTLGDGPCDAQPACIEDADCGAGERCVAGACELAPGCMVDADCLADQRCVEGACVMADGSCDAPMAIGFGVVAGDTSAQPAEQGASCGGGASGPELAHVFTADADGEVCFNLAGSVYDTVLHVRTACADAGSEVACNDDDRAIAGGLQSALTLDAQAGVSYFVLVDGFGAGSSGAYTLTVSAGACAPPPECLEDLDCAAGEICVDGVCGAPPPECVVDVDCADSGRCVDGACLAAPEACVAATPLALGANEGQTAGEGGFAGTCGGGGQSPEVAYTYTPDADGPFCVNTAGSAFDTVLYVMAERCSAAAELGCNDDDAVLAGPTQSALTVDGVAGTPYFVVVDGFTGLDGAGSSGAFTLTLSAGACAPPPECVVDADCAAGVVCVEGECVPEPDDSCATALPVQVGQVREGSTAGADAAWGATCGGGAAGPERVFALTADADGEVCLSTAGSTFDTVLHVRAGQCRDAGAEVACSDDAPDLAGGVRSAVTVAATAGETYYVFVDGFGVSEGDFVLRATAGACAPPPACAVDADCAPDAQCVDGGCQPRPPAACEADADCPEGERCFDGACEVAPATACDRPQIVGLPERRVASTAQAPAADRGSCAGNGNEVVYQFTADAAGPICASLVGSTYDTVIYVRADACADGAEVACNDDAVGLQSQVAFEGEAGTDYFVFVDGFAGSGNYVLSLSSGACDAAPCFADADCAGGEACVEGVCGVPVPVGCVEDAECAAGTTCQAGECRPEAGGTCAAPTLILAEGEYRGSTAGLASAQGASCGGAAASGERVYAFQVDGPGPVCLSTAGSAYDTVLHVRADVCDAEAAEIACNDDAAVAGGLQSAVTVDAVADTTYFVFVDGFGQDRVGDYVLTWSAGACQ